MPSYTSEDKEIDRLAKIIWQYHLLRHKLKTADCIFVLGSFDTRVAEYGAKLFLKRYAPLLIFSGGFGRLTVKRFRQSEAETFADIAVNMGVPKSKIIIENKSANTGENIIFTRGLLKRRGINPKLFILVQKPYMERRAYATFKKVWPGKKIIVTSPPISYEKYSNNFLAKDEVINVMVGDLQRIKLYPAKGFQIKQPIPKKVWHAFEELVKLGYNKHLIKI